MRPAAQRAPLPHATLPRVPPSAKARYPYRVFVSYSRQDTKLASAVIRHLESIGVVPISDHEIRVGEAFSREIQRMIECAHVFMPILTRTANHRLWVHQEIGYAIALRVPLCPLAVGDLPQGLASQIQAVTVRHDGGDLNEKVRYELIENLVARSKGMDSCQGRYECADELYDRQKMLAEYAQNALDNTTDRYRKNVGAASSERARACRLRQFSAFTSFSIPDVNVTHPDWDIREGADVRSRAERRVLRRERQIMERYAKRFGCDLILDPFVTVSTRRPSKPGPGKRSKLSSGYSWKHDLPGTRVRLKWILDFLESMSDDRLNVAFPQQNRGKYIDRSLISVGDWFLAEAVVPYHAGGGYRQTTFTHHGPTVLRRNEEFDQDFEDLLRENGVSRRQSRRRAIALIRRMLKEL